MVFTNFYASGNRTVRGLEAVTLCLPPTAGESVVKRKDNKDKFKIEDKDDSFRSGVSGIEDGDALSMDYDKFKIELQDSSKSVFSDTALPLTLNLSDFDTDHRKMELKFTASGGKELKIKGFIDSRIEV